jgi:glutamate 5-kinase
LVVDAGAAAVLRRGKSSLLAVGVEAVRGAFQAGDVVEVLDPGLKAIARGTAEYASEVVERVKGMRSAQMREALTGDGFAGDEIVHLDSLALL